MKKHKVLIVDDNPDFSRALFEILKSEDYIVLSADNVDAAIEIYKGEDDIVVIISDLDMPQKSGYDLIDEIMEISPNQKIIILSGFYEKEAPKAIAKGAHKMFPKPFNINELLNEIEEIISQSN